MWQPGLSGSASIECMARTSTHLTAHESTPSSATFLPGDLHFLWIKILLFIRGVLRLVTVRIRTASSRVLHLWHNSTKPPHESRTAEVGRSKDTSPAILRLLFVLGFWLFHVGTFAVFLRLLRVFFETLIVLSFVARFITAGFRHLCQQFTNPPRIQRPSAATTTTGPSKRNV